MADTFFTERTHPPAAGGTRLCYPMGEAVRVTRSIYKIAQLFYYKRTFWTAFSTIFLEVES
jgi:hypothetical protein